MTVNQTERGPVEYVQDGDGPSVLYFHGTGITCDGMLPFERAISESGFKLVMPNRPGYGDTPLASNRSLTDCADVVAALMDTLGIDTACVMGSSGGGAFAAAFAARHSDRANCLVLLCPQLHRWSDKSWMPQHSTWTLPLLKRRLLRKILFKLYAIQLPRMTAAQFLKMEAGSRYDSVRNDPLALELSRESLKAMASGPSHPGFENDMLVFLNEDIVTDSNKVSVPTLVLHDRCDPMAPVAHVDWFASLVKCECVPIHTAGHFVWAGPETERIDRKSVV